METIQATHEMNLPAALSSDQEDSGLLSLTMATLRLVNPWAVKKSQWMNPEPGSQDAKDRIISLNEVGYHDTRNDCWVVIYDRVYDITNFFDEHPGGADIMLEYAGLDATIAFRGSGHSRMAVKAMEKYVVGELPAHERLYRLPGGVRLSDMPE